MSAATVHIVGGGPIGLSLAYELLRRGRDVQVFDPDLRGGAGYGAAAGMLAPVSEAEVQEPALVAFGLESRDRYPAFVQGVEEVSGRTCGYDPTGTLWVAVDRDHREHLAHVAQTLEQKGLAVERLEAEALLELEPHLSSRIQGGLRVPDDRQLDPRTFLRALGSAVERLGGRIVPRRVVEVREHAGRVRGLVVLDDAGQEQTLDAERVAVCAGAETGRSLRLPTPDLRVRPVKGQLLRLRGASLLRHVLRTPEVYFVPRENGELLLGGTEEEMDDRTPTAGAALDLLRHGWQVLPGIFDIELAGHSVGLRPTAEDHLPVLGRTGVEGLFVSTGHFRGGVLLAPASAHHLAELIVSGEETEAIRPFSPIRLWRR